MNSTAAPIIPAATLIIVRDAAAGLEVLLLRRAPGNDYTSGAWVFPGGKVDATDHLLHEFCNPLDDATASKQLKLTQGGLNYYAAAIRECFEEAGLLFAHSQQGLLQADLIKWRRQLKQGEHSLRSLCAAHALMLATDQLVYLSHWLTPLGRPRRFDTRFFLVPAPADQVAECDGNEVIEHVWIDPAEALARSESMKLVGASSSILASLAKFSDVSSLLQWARSPRDIDVSMPRFALGKNGRQVVQPSEPAWAEVGRLDPEGNCTASCELVAGRAVRLSTRVIRVTASNSGVMTGPGTNTYLIGGGAQNEWAVIDPGPLDAQHVEAIVAAAPGAIRWIFATHTHNDHSPATSLLKEKTGATVHGQIAAFPHYQDASFVPDQLLRGDERFSLPGDCTLRVIHTPGHASNHICYFLEQEKTLFTGDHIMQGTTVIINPPDGSMTAYLASLRGLLTDDIEWLAPGHGFLMSQPQRVINWIIEHRLQRETKIVSALRVLGPVTTDNLLKEVYRDVSERLYGAAMRSLLAHLIKLQDDGVAVELNEQWLLRPLPA